MCRAQQKPVSYLSDEIVSMAKGRKRMPCSLLLHPALQHIKEENVYPAGTRRCTNAGFRLVIYYMRSITITITITFKITILLLQSLSYITITLASITNAFTITRYFLHHFQRDNKLYCNHSFQMHFIITNTKS